MTTNGADDGGIQIDRLRFSSGDDRLFGRSSEVAVLRDVLRRASAPHHRRSELVLLSGPAGTGKTTLAEQLRKPLLARGGFYVTGKFDQRRRVEPYTAFAAAIRELCDDIVARENRTDSGPGTRAKFREAVKKDGALLASVVPNVNVVCGREEEGTEDAAAAVPLGVGLTKGWNGFNVALQRLLRAVSDPAHPLAIFLDDVQWADVASLDLLRAIIDDRDGPVPNLLIICSYRNDEVDEDHPFATLLRDIEEKQEKGCVDVTKITVGNFDLQALNTILSDVLSLSEEETRALTVLVHRKTYGNIFFVKQFLHTLSDEGMLWFCFGTLRWRWDEERINAKHVTENVLDLLGCRLQAIPPLAQSVLVVAACFGYRFDLSMLELVFSSLAGDVNLQNGYMYRYHIDEQMNVREHLNLALAEGLVEKGKAGTYRFVHDQVQKAAASLVPLAEIQYLKLHIGEAIVKHSTPDEIEKNAFVIADLLNEAKSCVAGTSRRIELLSLNLKAGEKAIFAYAFSPAASYFNVALGLHRSSDWKDEHYDISLRLFSATAEVGYCTRDEGQMNESTQQVLDNAKSFRDRHRAYRIIIRSLAAQDRLREAFDTVLNILSQSGMRLPSTPRKHVILLELAKTKLALARHSHSNTSTALESLPVTHDEDVVFQADLLGMACLYSYMILPEYTPILICRLLRLSLCYGLHRHSAPSFAAYGVIMCALMGDPKRGYKFGQIALSLLERFQDRENHARNAVIVYCTINHWTLPAHLGLKPLLEAYEIGMEVGDIENAIMAVTNHCLLSYQIGKPMAPLEPETRAYCKQADELKQENVLFLFLPLLNVMLKLMGRSDFMILSTGEIADHGWVVKKAEETMSEPMKDALRINQLTEAYLFEDSDKLRHLLDHPISGCMRAHFSTWRITFLEGLAAFKLARHASGRKHYQRAKEAMKKIKRWVKRGNVNCIHMMLILKAENAALRGDCKVAQSKYDLAISTAGKHGYCQDRAIAYERAGEMLLEVGDKDWASHYLSRAYQDFFEWGAYAKSNLLRSKHGSIFTPATQERMKDMADLARGSSDRRARFRSKGPLDVGSARFSWTSKHRN